jgi:hypothetical protein
MNIVTALFTANVFEQIHQRGIGWNGLPFTHDALRVDDFAGEHGTTVHRELQNVHHLFAAVHFHVRARGHIKSTALRFLGASVIEQTPERSNGTCTFDGAVVHVNDARVGGGDFLPFCMRSMWRQHQQRSDNQGHGMFQKVCKSVLAGLHRVGDLNDSHTPYYKVVLSS